MKTIIALFSIVTLVSNISAQPSFEYNASKDYPYGRPNPKAPKEITDYQGMIGKCNCLSYRKQADGSWTGGVEMSWTFEYILNGMAVQDNTLKADGIHSGSIRQYDTDSAQWNVHYYSTKVTSPFSIWTGNKVENKIILYKPQQSPQGYDGFSRLTFYDIDDTGYKWIGEWVDVAGTISFPFWKIECKK